MEPKNQRFSAIEVILRKVQILVTIQVLGALSLIFLFFWQIIEKKV